MATARYDTEKFSGRNDFGLWRIKMRAILIQQGLGDAIKNSPSKDQPEEELDEKAQIMEKAHSLIILCLADNVLREVSKETTAVGIWSKLESLYMTKSLANRLFMKQRLYSYKFLEDRTIGEQLDEFNKAVDDLENVDVKLEDEDKAIILLNALPKSFDHLRDAMLYGRENTITLEEVQCALRSRELRKASSVQESNNQALSINKPKGKKKKFNAPYKAQNQKKEVTGKETRSCHYCKKPGHLKKDCYSWKKKQNEENYQVQNQADVVEDLEVGQVLNIVGGGIEHSWIMDSGCSFHICSRKSWFENLTESKGSVLLGNDQSCTVRGVGNIRLKLHDGSIKLLTQVRFIPDIKRNLIILYLLAC